MKTVNGERERTEAPKVASSPSCCSLLRPSSLFMDGCPWPTSDTASICCQRWQIFRTGSSRMEERLSSVSTGELRGGDARLAETVQEARRNWSVLRPETRRGNEPNVSR